MHLLEIFVYVSVKGNIISLFIYLNYLFIWLYSLNSIYMLCLFYLSSPSSLEEPFLYSIIKQLSG